MRVPYIPYGGFSRWLLTSTPTGPSDSCLWGLHQASDPGFASKEKDRDKGLLGSLLRAHYDPGFKAGQVPKLGKLDQLQQGQRGPINVLKGREFSQGSVPMYITNK